MSILDKNIGLYTDHYELTMAQAYFLSGKRQTRANFDYFFRKNPYEGGFVIFAGLSDLLSSLEYLRFDPEDIDYLDSLGFDKKFLEYLKTFRFTGDVYSASEGEVVFPNEPVLRAEGDLIETQLIESLVLNILNFESLIATKAARMKLVAQNKLLLDFGLRRAQGLGAIHASKAAVIGGFQKTSNTYSALRFGLDPSGTMAHSWVQTYGDELKAFRTFAGYYPNNTILLVDTYDTLKSGVPNAIKIAKEMEQKGNKMIGIRLDSGDLAYLAKKSRKMLDEAGLEYVKIVASNQLDEYLIKSLSDQGAPIDAFGVGTNLIIGKGSGALDGVYKLTQIGDQPTMKVSENITKMTLPGIKHVYRLREKENGCFYADGIELHTSDRPKIIYHPYQPEKNTRVDHYQYEDLVFRVLEKGKTNHSLPSVEQSTQYCQERIQFLPDESKRFENPHIYKVGIGEELMNLRNTIKETL